MSRPRNCIICKKPVPLIKGKTKTQSAKLCRATIVDGVRIGSDCQKTYRNKWHKDHYAEAKTKPKLVKDTDIVNNCLKCGYDFIAQSKFNRICEACTTSNENYVNRTATLLVAH